MTQGTLLDTLWNLEEPDADAAAEIVRERLESGDLVPSGIFKDTPKIGKKMIKFRARNSDPLGWGDIRQMLHNLEPCNGSNAPKDRCSHPVATRKGLKIPHDLMGREIKCTR